MNEVSDPRLADLAEQYKFAIDVATIASKTDPYGRITYVNDEFCRVSGYGRDELIGSPHNIVRHADMPREAFRDLWSTIKAKQAWTGVVKNRSKNGNPYWVNTTIVPLVGADSQIEEYIAIRSNITEVEEKRAQIELLYNVGRKFVPDQMLELQGVADITKINVNSGKGMILSVLFSDIEGFTTMSEGKVPEEIFTELNEFFALMEPCITDHRGVIDKFIGDSIMAIFQNPEDSVRAGLCMQRELAGLNAHRQARGQAALKIGIGVHTGRLVLGTIGTEKRMNPTVIGDTVNTAARIEHATRKLSENFLISEQTLAAMDARDAGKFSTHAIGKLQLRGKATAIRVFAVTG